MPMAWRRILDSFAFIVAVGVGAWLKYGLAMSWYAAIGCGAIVFFLIPFLGSRYLALYILRRMERQMAELETRRRVT